MTRLAAHPLAELFPLIEGADFGALVEDIRRHGVIDRIELLDGKILDGRNRYNALVSLVESGEVLGEGWGHRAGEPLAAEGLQPDNQWFRKFNRHVDGDPLPWVLSKNLKRRHLDESQRAMVAARLKTMKLGDNQHMQGPPIGGPSIEPVPPHIPPIGGISARAAAKLLNVGTRSVERAAAVLTDGTPELQHAVEQGKVAVSTAETIATLPQSEQAEIVARGEKEVLAAAKEIRSRQRRDRFEQVNQKLAAISEGSKPLPTGQRYPIIYADPATRYVSGFGDRSIENHYPTMTTEELCALPVGNLAMKDAVLFIWSTVPQLANTMKIIEAWGFTYVSEWCWDKVNQGTGHWAFNAHEPLLIATRGDFPAPVPGTQPKSLYREKKGDHSEKPAWFAEQIESIWPKLPKIELFCRSPRTGWAAWGNQADGSAEGVTSSLPAGESEPAVTQASPSAEIGSPTAPRVGEPMEYTVGGMRKNTARFGVRQRESGRFDVSYYVEFTTASTSNAWHRDFGSFREALAAVVFTVREYLAAKRDALDSLTMDAERRAAKSGLEWLERQCTVWCLDVPTESQAKASAGNGATEPDMEIPADSTSGDASRLTTRRMVGGMEDGVSVAPSSINELPGEGASGTARDAPSAGSGDVDLKSTSGTQSAPPQPVDDGLDIPAFLRRRKDNSLPDLKAAS